MKDPFQDPEKIIRQVANLTRTCMSPKMARLESEKETLMQRFREIENGDVSNIDYEAILVGFRKYWNEKNYQRILKAAKNLPAEFLDKHSDLAAYVEHAKKATDDFLT